MHPVLRQGVLDALVHADGSAEHLPLLGVIGGATECIHTQTDRHRTDDHPLRVHCSEDITEPLADLPNQIIVGYEQVVDEDHVGVDRLAGHLGYALHLQLVAVELRVKQGDAVSALFTVLLFCCAAQQQVFGRYLAGGGPYLAPVHTPAAVHLLSEGRNAGSVQSCVGLGDPKGDLLLPLHQVRQPALLLRVGAEQQNGMGAKQVDLNGGGRGHTAAAIAYRVHHHRRLGHAEVLAAKFLRHGNTQPAPLRHGPVKLLREIAVLVPGAPVLVREFPAHLPDALADGYQVFILIKQHGFLLQ